MCIVGIGEQFIGWLAAVEKKKHGILPITTTAQEQQQQQQQHNYYAPQNHSMFERMWESEINVFVVYFINKDINRIATFSFRWTFNGVVFMVDLSHRFLYYFRILFSIHHFLFFLFFKLSNHSQIQYRTQYSIELSSFRLFFSIREIKIM